MLEAESPKDFLRRKLVGTAPMVQKVAKELQGITQKVQQTRPYSVDAYRLLDSELLAVMRNVAAEIGLTKALSVSGLSGYIKSYVAGVVMDGEAANIKTANDYAAEIVADMIAFRDEDEGMTKAMDFVLRHPEHRRGPREPDE